MRVLSRRRNANLVNSVALPGQPRRNRLALALDHPWVARLPFELDAQLVQCRGLAQSGQSGTGEVQVARAFLPCGGKPGIMDEAADCDLFGWTVRWLDEQGLTGACLQHSNRAALDEHLAVAWRPRTRLGAKAIHPELPKVVDHEKQGPPPLVANTRARLHHLARLGLCDQRVSARLGQQVGIDRSGHL